jgi:hypothetical protein
VTSRTLPPAVPGTVLRVYEPLEAFDPADRLRWAEWLERPDASARAQEAERREAWRRIVRGEAVWVPPRPGDAPAGEGSGAGQGRSGGGTGVRAGGGTGAGAGGNGHVRVLRAGRARLVCPVATAGDESTPRRSLVRSWALPLPWLVLADEADRVAGEVAGRYLVAMGPARSRAARALKTLRRAVGPGDLTEEVEAVARWLEAFHPRSVLELDAHTVAELLGGEDGVADVRLGLECLAAGDVTGAAAAHTRLMRRSARLEGISRSC